MKVAYILHSSGTLGGATKALMQLVGELEQKGITPVFILPNSEGLFLELKKEGKKVYALRFYSDIYPTVGGIRSFLMFVPAVVRQVYYNRKATAAMVDIIRNEGIQLVHSNTSIIQFAYHAARKAGVHHVFHIREYADLHFNLFPSSRIVHQHLSDSYNICITKGIQHHYGLDVTSERKQSRVIYDGVLPRQSEPEYEPNGDYFLYAGRIEEAKGLDFLLQAYAAYVHQTTQPLPLKIAGKCRRPKYMRKNQKIISQHNLQAYVEFLGPRTDILKLMSHARATIIVSRFEGFGFCMAEAMFCGCLVVGRDTTGTHEQFENGLAHVGHEVGLRFKTVEELTAHLLLIGNQTGKNFLSIRRDAFKVVNTLYTAQASAQQVYDFYQHILS